MTDIPQNLSDAQGRTHQALCAIAAVIVLSTGCATTMNGSTQRVAVASDPPGARVFLGGESVGVTPTFVTLDRRDRYPALRFEKDCYQEELLEVPRRTSRWVVGNTLFAGVPVNEYTVGPWLTAMAVYTTVGALVDWRRGGAFVFPDLVRATLEPRWDPSEANDLGARNREATGPGVVVGPGGDCAPGARAGSVDQGNTPSDR